MSALTFLPSYLAFKGACGRAGESKHALKLFQSMKDEGLSADRVAYNALFSALRVAEDADKVSTIYEKREKMPHIFISNTLLLNFRHLSSGARFVENAQHLLLRLLLPKMLRHPILLQ